MEQWRKNLYTMMITQICCMIGFGLVSPFIAFYFQEMGMEMGAKLDLAVSLANTLPAVGMAIASPIWGMLSDRYGRKSMLVRACTFAGILMILMGLVDSVLPFLRLPWKILRLTEKNWWKKAGPESWSRNRRGPVRRYRVFGRSLL